MLIVTKAISLIFAYAISPREKRYPSKELMIAVIFDLDLAYSMG